MAPTPTRLILVRHGLTEETGSVLTGRLPGRHLSEEGRAQAKAVAQRLADLPVSAVYASPMERTMETASPIAERHGLEVVPLEEVLETDYGDWAGRELEELAETDLWKVVVGTPSRARFPEGESLRSLQGRAVEAVEGLASRHRGELLVVVSHADVIKAVAAHYAGMHLDLFQRLVVSAASLTVLALTEGRPFLLKLNDTGALEELAGREDRGA